jgi:hypothetical protein
VFAEEVANVSEVTDDDTEISSAFVISFDLES